MTTMLPMLLRRAEDQAPMGRVVMEGAAFRSCVNQAHPLRDPMSWHASLDAAVAWIEGSACLPDATTCPYLNGVFGPVLARWGGFRVVGCAFTNRGDLELSTLVVVDACGAVMASLEHSTTGWCAVIDGDDDMAERELLPWDQAVPRFRIEAMSTLVEGSMHQKMRLIEESALQDARILDFLPGLQELRASSLLIPTGLPLPQADVLPTSLLREGQDFGCGKLGRNLGLVWATWQDQHGDDRESMEHASFDAALSWLSESPYLTKN